MAPKDCIAVASLPALLLAGCAGDAVPEQALAESASVRDHYYPSEALSEVEASPWVIILPGGGGIDVFGDTEFYFDVAREWNAEGFDALVIHYQEAAPLLGIGDENGPGPMEAAVVADALDRAAGEGWIDRQCPGFVIGFSMGGAGVLTLAANPPEGLAGAIGRYPLVAGQPAGYQAQVPLLIQQGDSDDFTTTDDLFAFLEAVANGDRIATTIFADAEHGFDIPSTAQPIEFQGGIFQYQQAAAVAAGRNMDAFVASVLAEADSPAACARTTEG